MSSITAGVEWILRARSIGLEHCLHWVLNGRTKGVADRIEDAIPPVAGVYEPVRAVLNPQCSICDVYVYRPSADRIEGEESGCPAIWNREVEVESVGKGHIHVGIVACDGCTLCL